MKVRKQNNRREDFVREKIVVSVVKAGGAARMARNISRRVERALAKNRSLTTAQIRIEVLNRLKKSDAKTYRSWLAYDRQNKRR